MDIASITHEPFAVGGLQLKEAQRTASVKEAHIHQEIFETLVTGTYTQTKNRVESFLKETKANCCNQLLFGVQQPSKLFSGRVAELDRMKTIVNEYFASRELSSIMVITGLGGVGKTELVRKFIQKNDHVFKHFVWVNAHSEQSITRTFRTIANENFSISCTSPFGKPRPVMSIVDDVYAELEAKNTLIVFDNITQHNFQKFFPKLSPNCHNVFIIVTSRDGAWAEYTTGQHILLSTLPQNDALQLAAKTLNFNQITDVELNHQLTQLVCRLDFLPFAIVQATKYIQSKQDNSVYSIDDYMEELYKTGTKHVLKGFSYLQKKTYQILSEVLELVQNQETLGKLAVKFLRILSYFARAGLPNNILKALCRELKSDMEDIENSLLLLERFYLVEIRPKGQNSFWHIVIPRLVQDTVHTQLKEKDKEKKYLELAINLLQKEMTFDSLDHAISLWDFAMEHEQLVKSFYTFPFNVTVYLRDFRRPNDASNFATRAFNRLENVLPADRNSDYLIKFKILFGSVMLEKYQLEKSESFFEDMLRSVEEQVSKAMLLKLRVDKAYTLYRKCEYDIALSEFEDIYSAWTKISRNTDNPEVLPVLLCIGRTCRQLKDYTKALKTFDDVLNCLDERRKNPELEVEAMYYKALIEGNQGNVRQALENLWKVYEYAKRNLNPHHKLVLDIHVDIAVYQYRVGDFKNSLETSKQAHELSLESYGDEHHKTLLAERMICKNLSELGHHFEAYTNVIRIYKIYKKSFGKEYYHTVVSYLLVGMLLSRMGKHEEAIFILTECLQSKCFTNYASSFVLHEANYHLANSLKALKKHQKAREYLDDLIEAMKSINGFFLKHRVQETNDLLKTYLAH